MHVLMQGNEMRGTKYDHNHLLWGQNRGPTNIQNALNVKKIEKEMVMQEMVIWKHKYP